MLFQIYLKEKYTTLSRSDDASDRTNRTNRFLEIF